jgi:hypothetical protein
MVTTALGSIFPAPLPTPRQVGRTRKLSPEGPDPKGVIGDAAPEGCKTSLEGIDLISSVRRGGSS